MIGAAAENVGYEVELGGRPWTKPLRRKRLAFKDHGVQGWESGCRGGRRTSRREADVEAGGGMTEGGDQRGTATQQTSSPTLASRGARECGAAGHSGPVICGHRSSSDGPRRTIRLGPRYPRSPSASR